MNSSLKQVPLLELYNKYLYIVCSILSRCLLSKSRSMRGWAVWRVRLSSRAGPRVAATMAQRCCGAHLPRPAHRPAPALKHLKQQGRRCCAAQSVLRLCCCAVVCCGTGGRSPLTETISASHSNWHRRSILCKLITNDHNYHYTHCHRSTVPPLHLHLNTWASGTVHCPALVMLATYLLVNFYTT